MNSSNNGKNPMNFISDLVIYNKYASHRESLGRKQTWDEAIGELEEMQMQKYPQLTDEIHSNFKYVYDKIVLPSMRSIQFSGRPIEFNNARMFNCNYSPVNHPSYFSEFAFLIMCGSGNGYSIQKHHTTELPFIKTPNGSQKFLISDTTEGIADSFKALINAYMKGKPLPIFDYRDIRKKGTLIKKAGSIAPGPERTAKAHQAINKVLSRAIGRQLTPLEDLDITNYIAESIVSGGVREAACISLCDKDETDVITCKGIFQIYDASIATTTDIGWLIRYKFVENQVMNTNTYTDPDNQGYFSVFITNKFGDYDLQEALKNGKLPWYYVHPQRGKSNNSVVFVREETIFEEFESVMIACEESKAGEPGLYFTNDRNMGVNPCNEAALMNNQFCNLTTQNVFYIDSQKQLDEQSKAAAFLGTLQAGWTDLHYLRPIWKQNTEKDALLGVSMTGIASGKILKYDLKRAAGVVLDENHRIAQKIGINDAARTTLIKPEGSTPHVMKIQGAGIHAVHGHFTLKSFRIKKQNPIYNFLVEKLPSQFIEDEFKNEEEGAVLYVPIKADMNGQGIYRDEPMPNFLNRLKHFSENWIKPGHRSGANSHNVSATVSVKDGDWKKLTQWMWDNRYVYNGISCLPMSTGNYKQAPFQDITEQKYNELIKEFPEHLDLTEIKEEFNTTDHTTESLACSAGGCVL